ncbi:hypothetical protein GCM10027416_17850 [Okibacterium endophyticum]
MPGWAWWLIGGGVLILVAVIVVVALVIANLGQTAAPLPTPSDSTSETPDATPSPTPAGFALDQHAEFDADPRLVVSLPAEWDQVTDDEDLQEWENTETGCFVDVYNQTDAAAGPADDPEGDLPATEAAVEDDLETLTEDDPSSTSESGDVVGVESSAGDEVEMMLSRIDFVTDEGEDAFWLMATRVFVAHDAYLSIGLSCLDSEVEDAEGMFEDLLADVVIDA